MPSPPPQDDRFAPLWRAIRDAVLGARGTLDAGVRRAAFECGKLPQPLAAFVEKVHRHAYRITDEEVAALAAAGYDQDAIYEAVVCAAVGAGTRTLERGLAAIFESGGSSGAERG